MKYQTIDEHITSTRMDKKSKFISIVYYIKNKNQVDEIIKDIRKQYFDARHICYAYCLIKENNIIEKSNDDGEPAGTAGSPILNVIRKHNLVNVLIVVVRYFGGVLLGAGGLIRAYSNSATDVVEKSCIKKIETGYEAEIMLEYEEVDKFKYFCSINNIKIMQIDFLEKIKCEIEIKNINMLEKSEYFKRFDIKRQKQIISD